MCKFVRYWKLALLSLIISASPMVGASELSNKTIHSTPSTSAAVSTQNALNLYNQQKYAAAAVAFDDVIKTASPNATLYYYAALANQQSGKGARASQLFKYIVTNFSGSREAIYAQKVLAYKQSSSLQSNSQDSELPESVKNKLPSDMQALLKTDEGKKIVQQAMKDHSAEVQMIKEGEKQGLLETKTSSPRTKCADSANELSIDHPFSAQDIARDGAGGIDQGRNPNCWFEASISSLAQLPRGQKLLADTIRSRRGNSYIVRFHNDGVEYVVSQADLKNHGIHDKALWASLIEYAELKKFPDNKGANGADDDQSRLEIGLGSITGRKAEVIYPTNYDIQALSSFIGAAIKSQNPIIAATYGVAQLATMPEILVPSHAYTVIDFDPSKSIVTVRNPHGRKSEVFHAPVNSTDIEFQQLGDGVIKVGLTTFQKYFHSVARSFI